MKFTVKQEDLNKALQNLVRNTTEKHYYYKSVKIEQHSNDRLKLTATNGIVTMVCKVPAIGVEGESVLVNAKKINDIVARLSGNITFNDGVLKSGKSKIKLDIESADNFISVEGVECELNQINAMEFKNALKGRLFACDTVAQTVIGGICIDKDSIVSTNGNMLALYTLNTQLPFDTDIVINNKLALEIVKCFEGNKIKVGFDKRQIVLADDNVTIYSRLIDGQFPPYKKLIPTPKYTVQLDKSLVVSNLELLNITTDELHKYCTFVIDDNKLSLVTFNGETELEIEYNEEPMKISFNISYLLDVLKNIDSEVVDFGFTAPLSPCLISAGQEVSLIMPMQVKG